MSSGPPPGHGPPAPPYYAYPPPPPAGSYAYVPVLPMPVYPAAPPPPPAPSGHQQSPYITNHYYQQPPAQEPVRVVETIEQSIDWVPATPSTAQTLAHRAVIAGRDGWDGCPLWVIRAHHSGECIPGKLAIRRREAYVPHAGLEVPVHNFEVMCAPPHKVFWITASNGQVPAGAIAAGNTHTAEPLYIARVNHMNCLTPGKVHPSHGCCYISFGHKELSFKNYEVLCRSVG